MSQQPSLLNLRPADTPLTAGLPGGWTALAVVVGLALYPLLMHGIGADFYITLGARILILALAASALNLALGYGGMISLGHAAFLGTGAYTVAFLMNQGVQAAWLAVPAGVAVAALAAFLIGAASLRTSGVYFIMITLAFGQMAYFFMVSLAAYGGDDGLPLSGRSTLFGMRLIEGDPALFYCVLAVLTAALLVLRRVVASRFGRVLRGSRDNAVRMQAIGFSPLPYRLTAYVIAGAIAGLAGVLLANQAEFVSPAYMSWQRSGELIVMVVLGGMGTLVGPVVGAAALIALEEVLAHYSDHWRLGLGLMLVAVVLLSRGGLAGLAAKIGRRA